MFDLVIANGSVVDGTGSEAFNSDIGITDGRVAEIGPALGPARRKLSADGALVTPGFVDIHTHYDGQATWDPLLTPSCWHGVTTVVMGNCGVGFAPVEPDHHDWLIALMEGVEDIPGAALAAGIDWSWESFGEYLDALERLPRVMDVGTQVPHGAVRAYVMGERGAANEPATAQDIAAMADIVRSGIQAGALGFSTSRTLAHRAIDGEPVPGTFAAEDELFGIGAVLGELGTGVFELAAAGALGEDLGAPVREIDWMVRLSRSIGRPVSFALTQNNADPNQWRELLALTADADRDGATVLPQVHGRTVSLLLGLQTFHPAQFCAAWGELGLGLMGHDDQVRAMGTPEIRERLLRELEGLEDDPVVMGFMNPANTYLLGDPPQYEPGRDRCLEDIARREERSKWDVLLDALLTDGGTELLNAPVLNYSDGNLDAAYTMLSDSNTVFGLGDGGAHAGQTCDASTTTFMLSHWARDRGGPKLSIPDAVHKMTGATAGLYGLGDRGTLEVGKTADVNVIDFDSLSLLRPEWVNDLPSGAGRLIQRADGYVATIKSGEVTFEHGQPTDARPGVLLRGER
jgi:N-acyl-D-aspartate/D-glutamate deacylase